MGTTVEWVWGVAVQHIKSLNAFWFCLWLFVLYKIKYYNKQCLILLCLCEWVAVGWQTTLSTKRISFWFSLPLYFTYKNQNLFLSQQSHLLIYKTEPHLWRGRISFSSMHYFFLPSLLIMGCRKQWPTNCYCFAYSWLIGLGWIEWKSWVWYCD